MKPTNLYSLNKDEIILLITKIEKTTQESLTQEFEEKHQKLSSDSVKHKLMCDVLSQRFYYNLFECEHTDEKKCSALKFVLDLNHQGTVNCVDMFFCRCCHKSVCNNHYNNEKEICVSCVDVSLC